MAGTLATVKIEDMATGTERVLSFMLQEGDRIEVTSNVISIRAKHYIDAPLEPPPTKGRRRDNHFFNEPQPIAKPTTSSPTPVSVCPVKPGAPSRPETVQSLQRSLEADDELKAYFRRTSS